MAIPRDLFTDDQRNPGGPTAHQTRPTTNCQDHVTSAQPEAPPTNGSSLISMSSKMKKVKLYASPKWGYGLSLSDGSPCRVIRVDPPGPAYHSGVKTGDLVLEVNGDPIQYCKHYQKLLKVTSGCIVLSLIQQSTKDLLDSNQHHQRTERSQELFNKMNVILNKDYRSKIAITSLLKNYAENHDIELFSISLLNLLKTTKQRLIFSQLRQFVPLSQKLQFDAILNNHSASVDREAPQQVCEGSSNNLDPGRLPSEPCAAAMNEGSDTAATTTIGNGAFTRPSSHDSFTKIFKNKDSLPKFTNNSSGDSKNCRFATIYREDGIFGFVLKGDSPVTIESILPKGPADLANLKVGDIILSLDGADVSDFNHKNLVEMLQISGPRPVLGVISLRDKCESLSSLCDDESRKFTFNEKSYNFNEFCKHLLTIGEKFRLKNSLQNYKNTSNISRLVSECNVILNTPNKRNVWHYLAASLPYKHQKYLHEQVNITSATTEHTSNCSSNDSKKNTPARLVSFRQQIRYLLTSKERLLLKKCLQNYVERRNINNLLDDIQDILDTPSKKSLWVYILGLLSHDHQKFCERKLEADKFSQQISEPTQLKTRRRKLIIPDNTSSKCSLATSQHHNNVTCNKDTESPIYAEIGRTLNKNSENNKDVITSKDEFKNITTVDESFEERAMTAIKVLDDVVAGESVDDCVRLESPPLPPPLPPDIVLGRKSKVSHYSPDMKVKRLNWEKIDVVDKESVWAHMNDDLEDIVKYLELEQQFSTKRNHISFKERKHEIGIISAKKAYNISILLGHMRMSVNEIKAALTRMDETLLTNELLKQMIAYAPDSKEMESYNNYKGNIEDLSLPDQFVYQMSRLSGYEYRLKSMLFKENFSEKVGQLNNNLGIIKKASMELQHSHKLLGILELVLAMGNQLNKGNTRIEQASAFHVNYLNLLDMTKTTDGKSNFLFFLVSTIHKKFPENLKLSQDLQTIPLAAKVTSTVSSIKQDIEELKVVLEDISNNVNKLNDTKSTDKFYIVMQNFIAKATEEIKDLEALQTSSISEYDTTVNYFGEKTENIEINKFFKIFDQFLKKFERAQGDLEKNL